ncbi:MAG: helix-turn-helix domain-containing protein [Oscillospiraceae bacterium]|nr:helix-turn-helix domain-containing protein [Oscillospiraceae bacterium]
MNRIKELRAANNVKQADLAAAICVSQAALSGYETGKFQADIDTYKKIAAYFDVSLDYLLGMTPNKGFDAGHFNVPVLGDVAAGIPIEAITDIVDYEEIDAALARTGDFFGLRIKGDSMEPRMKEGDVVIVRQQDTAETGDTVVVLVNGNSATVKKIKYGPDGITLLPTNPTHDPLFYSAAEVEQLPVRVIGRVVELRAKY